MTTDETKVSGDGTGEVKLPQPSFSETTPASSTSAFSPENISALSEALKPVIEDAVERKLQSTKDKRFSALEKGESAMKEVLATLKEQGVQLPPKLEQEFQIKEAVDAALKARGVTPEANKSMSADGVGKQGDQFNVIAELNNYGLSTNDPDVVSLVGGRYQNPDQLRLAMANLALKKAKPSTPSATLSAAPVGDAPKPDTEKEMIGNYQKEMLAAQGRPEQVRQVMAKYKKLGLDTGKVAFT
jgi:hypothetical protein